MSDAFSRKFTPLTEYNTQKTNVLSSILGVSDETMEKGYPDRNAFYIQWLASHSSKNPNVFRELMNKVGLAIPRNKKITSKLGELESLVTNYYNDPNTSINNESGQKVAELKEAIERALKNSAYSNLVTQQKGGSNIGDYLFKGLQEPARENIKEADLVKRWQSLQSDKDKKIVAERLYRHPIYTPDNNNVQFVDRAIFVALTYIVRAIALFITEWAIFSGYISTFNGAFNLYFGMYICVFLLLVFITNAHDDDKIFKVLLFYINSTADNGKGLTRIVVHILCVLLVLPIPYIVKDYTVSDVRHSNLSFSDKASILSSVDKFTLYVWILTTIVGFNL